MHAIHHYGTFDVDNYGDLLFPKIIEWRLREYKIQHISPSRHQSCFLDASKSLDAPTEDALATMTGGGNIVRFNRTPLSIYSGNPGKAYPSLVIQPFMEARRSGRPYIINAPSIATSTLNIAERITLSRVLRSANYISFRDQQSTEIASGLTSKEINLVPDTAFDISRMWPEFKAQSDHIKDYAVFHVNSRYGGGIGLIATALDKFASETGLKVVLLPIGPCHGDYEHAQEIKSLMSSPSLVFDDFRLKAFAKTIAKASLYVGSSMHGFITAASYGVPCGLILNSDPMSKFDGVLQALNLDSRSVGKSWSDLNWLAAKVVSPKKAALTNIFDRLDTHWETVIQCLKSERSKETSSPRMAYSLIWASQISKRGRRRFQKLTQLSM